MAHAGLCLGIALDPPADALAQPFFITRQGHAENSIIASLNRLSQQLEPELATSWKVTDGGKTITFKLRQGVRFSDGTPFSAQDVAYTMQQLMDPALHSPTGDSFRSTDGKVITNVVGKNHIMITFPAPVVGLDKLFDQVAIMSAASPEKEMAVLGPYYVAENKAGSYLRLKRNPNYWKHDAAGRQLPYIDSIRLDIQENRDMEMLRLVRGEIDFINTLDAEYFDKLASQAPGMANRSLVRHAVIPPSLWPITTHSSLRRLLMADLRAAISPKATSAACRNPDSYIKPCGMSELPMSHLLS